jgi:hypothetical protein
LLGGASATTGRGGQFVRALTEADSRPAPNTLIATMLNPYS